MHPVTSASSGSINSSTGSAGDDRNNTRSAHASSDDTTSVLSNTCSASASTSSSSSSVVFDSSDCETAQQSTDRLSRVRRSAKNSNHRSRHTNQMTTNNFCREGDKRSSNTATTTASSTNTTNISTRRERRSERSAMDRKSRSSRNSIELRRPSLVPIPAPSAATSSSTTTASAPRKSTSATKLPSSSSSSSIATTATAVSDAKFDKYGSARKIRKRSTSSSRNRRDLGDVSVASKSKSKSKAKADKSSRRTKDSKRTSKVVDSEAVATGSTSAAALAKSKKRSGDAKAKYRRTKTAAASPPPTATTTTTTTTTATTTATTNTAATSKAPTAEPHKVVHSNSNVFEGGSPVEPRALRTTMKTQMSAGIASSGSIHPPTTAHKDALFDVIYELVADVLSRIGVVCDVELFEFMETLAEESNSHEDTLVTAIIYIWRVHNKLPDLRVGRGDTGHALFLAALLLAWKVTYDKAYYNSSWAKIAAVAGHPFSNAHVNSMEIELLSFLNYDMHVSAADYNSVLGACSDEAANRCAERLSAEFNSFADRTHDFDGMLDTSGDSGDDWDPSNRPMPAALQRSSKCLDLSGTADSFEATTLFGKTGGSDSDVLAPTLAH